MKALLMFIWTILVSFVLSSFMPKLPTLFVLSLGYLAWSIGTPFIVRLPIEWIKQLANKNAEMKIRYDKQLVLFESRVITACWITGIISLVTLIAEIITVL